MAEPFQLEQQEVREYFIQEQLCTNGLHKPDPLWEWRCLRCQCLLCRTCSEEIDRCPRGGNHGR